MKFSDKWVSQSNWNENIAAILSSYCRIFGLRISNTTIFKDHIGNKKMAHFDEVSKFCKKWKIEHISLKFAIGHLDEEFLPAFVLMDGYRTQLVTHVENDIVTFLDGQKGWLQESKDTFFNRSMGHVILVDHSEYKQEPNFDDKIKREEEKNQADLLNYKLKVIDDFLSPEECTRLIAKGDGKFVRSEVTSIGSEKKSVKSKVRTSSSAFLVEQDEFLDVLRKRAAKLIDVDYKRFEPVQLTTYAQGQEYEVHTDAFLKENKHDLKPGQRTHTILVYLNDDFEGGETLFPKFNLKMKAKTGRAIVWRSLDNKNNIDPRGYHGGLPVYSGRKYISNLWVREGVQDNWEI